MGSPTETQHVLIADSNSRRKHVELGRRWDDPAARVSEDSKSTATQGPHTFSEVYSVSL